MMDEVLSGLIVLNRMIDADPNGKLLFRDALRARLTGLLGAEGYMAIHFATNAAKNAVLATRRGERRGAAQQMTRAVQLASKLQGMAAEVAWSFLLSAEAYGQHRDGRFVDARSSLGRSIRMDLSILEPIPEMSGHIVQSHFNLARLDRAQFGEPAHVEQLLDLLLAIEALLDGQTSTASPRAGFPSALYPPQLARAFHGQISSELMRMERAAVALAIAQRRRSPMGPSARSWGLAAIEAIGTLQDRKKISLDLAQFASRAPSVPMLAVLFRHAAELTGLPISERLVGYLRERGAHWVW